MSKKLYSSKASDEPFHGCRCTRAKANCWREDNCRFVPEFGIATSGELERTACDFINWALQSNNAIIATDTNGKEELRITNGIAIMPPAMRQAAAVCSEDGKPNLIKRYKDYLEKAYVKLTK